LLIVSDYHRSPETTFLVEIIGVDSASIRAALVARRAAARSMTTRGAPARRRKLPSWLKPIAAGGFLLTATSGAYLTLSHLQSQSPSPAPDMRTGSIIILSRDLHACRHLKFDNTTGKTKDLGTGNCNDPSESAAARLGQVSDSFMGK
jgi:hypothetical protein